MKITNTNYSNMTINTIDIISIMLTCNSIDNNSFLCNIFTAKIKVK